MLDSVLPSQSQKQSMRKAAEKYNGQINQSLASYLTARGITKQAANGFLLGLVSDPEPEHQEYEGRLAIPYITHSEQVVGFKFRCIECVKCEGHGKYLGLPGQRAHLYNSRVLATSQPLVAVVEGELDAVILSAVVGVPAVGLSGGGAWLPHFPRCFDGVERVAVVMDNDRKPDGSNPGQGFTEKLLRDLPRGFNVKPPEGMDLGEWYLSEGPEPIRKALGQ